MRNLYRLLYLFCCTIALNATGQTTIGLSPAGIAYFPDTVFFNDTVTYTVWVRNYGPSMFNGDIEIHTGVYDGNKSLLTIAIDSSTLKNTSNFMPGDSLPVNLFHTYTPNYYQAGINTVVIWPVTSSPNVSVSDSLTDSVYVRGYVGWNDHDNLPARLIALAPNPASNAVTLLPAYPGVYVEYVRIYDTRGRSIARYPAGTHYISISGLERGVYIIEVGMAGNERAIFRVIRE